MRQINRVAVLGAGVMGATIAAHLANAGLDVLLLDMVPAEPSAEELAAGLTLTSPQVRNRIARQAVERLPAMKPAPLYLESYARQIEIGNFDDHLSRLGECDWVIEAVVEQLSVKQGLLERIAPYLAGDTILSTNTSGLSVNVLSEVLPEAVRKNFLVTHFFNPPRYMHLLEIVPCLGTDPGVIVAMADFIGRQLGKGIVYAKDTPNFIANRIGVYAIFKGIEHMMAMGMTVEEVDAIAGPATGRPKSAAFRTADLVGIDTLVQVGHNSFQLLTEDDERAVFEVPAFMVRMVEQGLLGNKSRAGFYRRQQVDGKRQIFYYDYPSGEFKPLQKPQFASLAAVKMVDDPALRVKMMVEGHDKAAEYAWKSLRDTLIYCIKRIPEIADDVVNIDNAMKWGFNWELGPFEMLDAIGPADFVKRTEDDGLVVPDILRRVASFYRFDASGQREYFDLETGEYRPVPIKEGQVNLQLLKKSGGVVEKSAGCTTLDLGDGVFALEFHSKMNAISGDILAMTHKAIRRAETEGVGLVIGNQGANFSVGANLMLLAVAMAEGAWEDIDMMVRTFQKATMAIKCARVPVVAAPHHMTLGGGCEFCLHAAAINAAAETYMGLVEVGVGLLPAGGGTKEMCLRAVALSEQYDVDVSPFIFKHFRQIAMARVSSGAAELTSLGYLREGDCVTMHRDRLLADAKQKVLALAVNYRPQRPLASLPAPGRSVAASIKSQLWNLQMGGHATDYEAQMGGIIASVICGGDVPGGTPISEDYLLQLEREGFLKLCGNRKTGERIQHMLKTGKPLRN